MVKVMIPVKVYGVIALIGGVLTLYGSTGVTGAIIGSGESASLITFVGIVALIGGLGMLVAQYSHGVDSKTRGYEPPHPLPEVKLRKVETASDLGRSALLEETVEGEVSVHPNLNYHVHELPIDRQEHARHGFPQASYLDFRMRTEQRSRPLVDENGNPIDYNVRPTELAALRRKKQ